MERRNTADEDALDETTGITHHDEGVSCEVTIQDGSSSDRVRVKAKLKSRTLETFQGEKDEFLDAIRDSAEESREIQQDVFEADE
ncbi:hypothetical protein [Natronosalvus amylolyticus]|uniref:hypothetical protein n=1 Tax=Natronosalvus amylolyticus TaxID=2961994 RepID=UPI0020CA050F|nr:hypothetical protein [Natronosalvus amylolyticus]